MVQIVLIRPGRTEFDEQRRIQGTLDIPLCEAGVNDVQRLYEELRGIEFDVIYTSPCQAARETADLLSDAFDVKVKELDQLANLDQGLWQGRCIDEVRQTQPTLFRQWQENPESICPPSGEPVAKARERVKAIVAKLRRKHEGQTIAIVAPEPIYCLTRCELAGEAPRDLWKCCGEHKRWDVVTVGEPQLAPTG
jgi:broad specificity phosphatase PhoE